MDLIQDLLTPEQIDAIVAVYGTVANWFATATDYLHTQISSVVSEDMHL